jgi:hypothetical protein
VETTIRTGRGHVLIEARNPDDSFRNGLDLQATVAGPDGTSTLETEQTAPGRYETSFAADTPGAYLVNVSESGILAAPVSGAVLPYPPEHGDVGGDRSLLVRVAELSEGHFYDGRLPDVFAPPPDALRPRRPLSAWLIGLAALLLVSDIILRTTVPRPPATRSSSAEDAYRRVRRDVEESRRTEATRARNVAFWFGADRTGDEERTTRLHVPRGAKRRRS